MKTGFTCASGYNVVASATRDGHRLIAIVLGAVSRQKRSERATELLEAGFAHLTGVAAPDNIGHEALAALNANAGVHANASAPIKITPVALGALEVNAGEAAAPPEDIARQLRSRKCRGYGGFAKKETEPAVGEADMEDDADHGVTSSITPPTPQRPVPAVAAKVPSAATTVPLPKKAAAVPPPKTAAPKVPAPKSPVTTAVIQPPAKQQSVAHRTAAIPAKQRVAKPVPVPPTQQQALPINGN